MGGGVLNTLKNPTGSVSGAMDNPNVNKAAELLTGGGSSTLGKVLGLDGSSAPSQDWSAIQQGKLATVANQTYDMAQQYMTYYQQGKLPPDMQAQLKLLTEQTTSSIKSQFAALGLSGSTMEASALANAATEILAEKANMIQTNFTDAMSLFQVDLAALGQSTNLNISNNEIGAQQSAQTMQSIGTIGEAVGSIALAA